MDGVILVAIIIPSMIGLFHLLLNLVTDEGGTKGLERDPYYGRKSGKIYTAKKDREKHLV